MSVTALLWITLYCAASALSLLSAPLFGALGYLLEYYMRPELKWWGDELPPLRWNLIIAIVLGVTFLIHRRSLRELVAVPNPALRWLVGLALVMVTVTSTVAVNAQISWDWMLQWLKMALIFPLLVIGVVRTLGAFNAFVTANMLGAFWWGWDAWTRPKRAQGRLLNIGSGDTLNDNAASAHLLTVLPFIVIILLTEKDKRMRAIALVAAPFVINTLILCNSRGAMLAMATSCAAALLLIRRRYRFRMLGAALGLAAALFGLADQTFIDRQQTTEHYEEDGSAMERLFTWKAAFRLISERPFGAGGRGFHLLSPIYIPEVVSKYGGDLRAPHNTWVMVTSEWGIPGLICFCGMFVSAFVMAERIKKRATAPWLEPYYWRAFAIELALIAYLVASVFEDRVYAEAGYWMVALAYALYRIQLTDISEAAAAPVPSPATAVPLAANLRAVHAGVLTQGPAV